MLEILKKLPSLTYAWIEPNLSSFNTDRQLSVWLAAFIIGCIVSVAAILFRELIGLVQWSWLFDRTENIVSATKNTPWYILLLVPAFGGAVVGWIITNFLPLKRTGGIPDVMEARAIDGRDIEIKSALISAGATAVSLGAGASAGREGPMVHLAAGLATWFSNLMKVPHDSKNTILASSAAAAVSASFNAPIAGVLFAHEIILGHYSRRSFVPIVISAVSGTIFSRLWFGDVAAFEIPAYQISSYWEFPAFAILGLVCALVSVIFQFALVGTDHVARNIEIPLFWRPVIGGFLIGLIAIFYPEILGVGYEATDMALKNQLGLELLLALLVAKTAATSITIASRFGGGVFSPALYLGAMAGGAFGLIASNVFPELASSQGLYALLGMGAVAAAVIGAPFSTTMIVFELTGGYTLSIALLLAVSIATGINQAIHGHSLFEWQLEMRGLFFRDGPHKYVMRSNKVKDFMTLVEADSEPAYLTPQDDEDPVFLQESDSLEYALRMFDDCGLPDMPVIDTNCENIILGHATQVRALSHFNKALVAASEEEHHG